jgi:hypothetical protein
LFDKCNSKNTRIPYVYIYIYIYIFIYITVHTFPQYPYPDIFYALELVLAIDDQKGPDSNYYPCRTKHTEPSIHPFSVTLIQEWERNLTEC